MIEWPDGESEPTKYWFSTEATDTPLRELVKLAKHRWIIERDYEELKQELGLGPSVIKIKSAPHRWSVPSAHAFSE